MPRRAPSRLLAFGLAAVLAAGSSSGSDLQGSLLRRSALSRRPGALLRRAPAPRYRARPVPRTRRTAVRLAALPHRCRRVRRGRFRAQLPHAPSRRARDPRSAGRQCRAGRAQRGGVPPCAHPLPEGPARGRVARAGADRRRGAGSDRGRGRVPARQCLHGARASGRCGGSPRPPAARRKPDRFCCVQPRDRAAAGWPDAGGDRAARSSRPRSRVASAVPRPFATRRT